MGDERIRRITTILLRDADDHGRQAVGASRDHHDYVRTALYDVVDTIATLTRERDEARARGIAEERARVVAMQRALQTTAADDPLLGSANVGAASYRVRDRSKFQRGVDLAKIAEKLDEGDFAAEDLEVLAGQAGHLLARSHARAKRQGGEPGLAAIAAALASEPEGFVSETVGFVRDYAPVLRADYERFLAAIAADGPSLGYSSRP